MTHTLPESSTDLDVDALLAGLRERHTPSPAAAKSSTAEVDELLSRALRDVGLTALMQPRRPASSPSPPPPDLPQPTERAAPAIDSASIPLPPPQPPYVLTETQWSDGSQGLPTLLEFSPNTEGVYAHRPSVLRRRARPLTKTLGRLAENVLGIWVAAIAIVTATIVMWTREAPVRQTPQTSTPQISQTSTPPTPPPAAASRASLETGGGGAAAVASAPPREPIAPKVERPVGVVASRASRAPIERSRSNRSDRSATRRAENTPAPAAPAPEFATAPQAPPPAEPPASPPEIDMRAVTSHTETRPVTDVVAQSSVLSELTLPATAHARERATPTVASTSAPPTIVSRVQPVYPTLARSAGVQGSVRVEVTVDERGHVVRTSATTGPAPLRAAAEAAVRQWRFTPAIVNGVPQPGSGAVTVVFRLQ